MIDKAIEGVKSITSTGLAWTSAGVAGGGVVLGQVTANSPTTIASVIMSLIAFFTFIVKGVIDDRASARLHSESMLNLSRDLAEAKSDAAASKATIEAYRAMCGNHKCPFTEDGKPACLTPVVLVPPTRIDQTPVPATKS